MTDEEAQAQAQGMDFTEQGSSARWGRRPGPPGGPFAPPGPIWPEPALPPVWPEDADWPDWPPFAYWPSGPFGPVPWRKGWACPGPTWDFCTWSRWEATYMSTVVPLWSGPSPWYPPWWFRTWKQRPVPLEGEPGGAEGATHPTERIHPSVAEAGEGEAGAVPTIAHIGQPRYADPEDLARVGLTHRALLGTAENVQETALQFASRLADSYLGVRFRVPLFRWGDDLRLNVAQIAAWRIMAARGYDPSTPNDQQVLRVSYEDAIAWLQQIRARQAVLAPPAGVVSGGPPWGWGGGWGQRWPPERWQDAGPRCVVF